MPWIALASSGTGLPEIGDEVMIFNYEELLDKKTTAAEP